MKTLSSLALSSALLMALAAGASAQTTRSAPVDAFDELTTGRSAYIDRAPRDATGDGIVMGLRVPNGPQTPDVSLTR